ncbi:MAG: hypothetical protein ABIW17_10505, partial [Marmoricola sp.]
GRGGRRLVVYDEAWRMLRHLALVRRMQAQWRLSRALGVANLAVVHRISDLGAVGITGSEAVALAQGLLADCSTRVVYAQESDQVELTTAALGLSDVEADELIHLPRGRGLWRFGRHAAIVDHILGDTEFGVVDTEHPHARAPVMTSRREAPGDLLADELVNTLGALAGIGVCATFPCWFAARATLLVSGGPSEGASFTSSPAFVIRLVERRDPAKSWAAAYPHAAPLAKHPPRQVTR